MSSGNGRLARRDWRAFLRTTERRSALIGALAAEHQARLDAARSASSADWRSFHRRIAEDFGDLDARDLTAAHVTAWLDARRADGDAPNTLCRVLSMLSILLDHGVRTGALDDNPARHIDRAARPRRRLVDVMRSRLAVLSPAELRTILEPGGALGTPWWESWLWAVMAATGQRIGEVSALTWGCLRRDLRPLPGLEVTEQWHTKSRSRRRTKDGFAKRVPVRPELLALLDLVPGRFYNETGRAPVDADPLCPYFHGGEVGAREVRLWNQRTALKRWKDYQEAHLTVPITGPRDLRAFRHTLITRLRAAGASPQSVRAITHPGTVDARARDAHDGYAHDHLEWPALCRAVLALDLTREEPQLTLAL